MRYSHVLSQLRVVMPVYSFQKRAVDAEKTTKSVNWGATGWLEIKKKVLMFIVARLMQNYKP